jgi:hypothetical protein
MQNLPGPRRPTLTLWLLLLGLTLVAFAFVAIPAWLIQPFKPQDPGDISISYTLKHWSPTITALAMAGAAGLAWLIWSRSRRWWVKAGLVLPLILIGVFVWFSRQNHFEWMFKPLPDARFVSVREVDFVGDNEMVLAIEINDDAVAFPVRQIAYHHVVNDVVGGKPITATY